MPGKKLGRECVLARGTSAYANQTWNTIAEVVDLNHKDAAVKGDVSSRASKFKKSRRGLRDVALTFGLRYSSTDDDHIYLRAAYANEASIDFWVADGLTNSNTTAGPRFWGQIMEFSHDQPLEDGVLVNVEVAPTDDGTNTEEPIWWP